MEINPFQASDDEDVDLSQIQSSSSHIFPPTKKQKIGTSKSDSLPNVKDALTCEVLKAEKLKLESEQAYYMQKINESIAAEQAFIAKKAYYDSMIEEKRNYQFSNGSCYRNM